MTLIAHVSHRLLGHVVSIEGVGGVLMIAVVEGTGWNWMQVVWDYSLKGSMVYSGPVTAKGLISVVQRGEARQVVGIDALSYFRRKVCWYR